MSATIITDATKPTTLAEVVTATRTRDYTIARIKKALKERSDRPWSVTGGRGTAYGWITIDAPPRRRTWQDVKKSPELPCIRESYEERDMGTPDSGHMGPDDRAELGRLFGFENPVHHQGLSIPSSSAYYAEYIDRAEGRPPSVIGEPYWD